MSADSSFTFCWARSSCVTICKTHSPLRTRLCFVKEKKRETTVLCEGLFIMLAKAPCSLDRSLFHASFSGKFASSYCERQPCSQLFCSGTTGSWSSVITQPRVLAADVSPDTRFQVIMVRVLFGTAMFINSQSKQTLTSSLELTSEVLGQNL